MGNVQLTFACELNDRTKPLYDGSVSPRGINLNFLALQPEETFWRQLQFGEFDVSEMSMSSLMIAKDKGIGPDMVAIPAFPSRYFRHSLIFINADSGIEEPADLRGRTVGIPEYQMTATLWERGILQHEYDVHPSDLEWIRGGLESPNREERLELDLPDDVHITDVKEKTLNDMLVSGEIDALLTARDPSSFGTSDSVQRLFPNYRDVEIEYHEKTGFFPIMHTIAFKREVLEEHQWAARELYIAFEEAKDHALDRLSDSGVLNVAIPWLHSEIEDTKEVMGEDYWPYGIEENREELEMMTQFSYEQGLIDQQLEVEDLFALNASDEFKV